MKVGDLVRFCGRSGGFDSLGIVMHTDCRWTESESTEEASVLWTRGLSGQSTHSAAYLKVINASR
jgi:hypothetical protein